MKAAAEAILVRIHNVSWMLHFAVFIVSATRPPKVSPVRSGAPAAVENVIS